MTHTGKSSQQDELRRFFGPGKALQAVRASLADCRVVRIATAFFEPSGWGLLDDILEGKQVRLLIGREEGVRDKIGDLLNEFLADVENGQLRDKPELLRKVMKALRMGKLSIRLSENKIQTALDPRYLYHHAKLYIADERQVLVTSANFTRHGLLQSREAGFLVSDPPDVDYFVMQFDLYFDKAESVTEYFIEALEHLLELRSPREVYARSLHFVPQPS